MNEKIKDAIKKITDIIDTQKIYKVKNVKNFWGREAKGFSCSLYKNGKKIGTVTDTADGGIIDFYIPEKEITKLNEFCEKNDLFDKDMFIAKLVDRYERNKKIKRMCKKRTVIKDIKTGKIFSYQTKFSQTVKEELLKRYNGSIYFYNEHINEL